MRINSELGIRNEEFGIKNDTYLIQHSEFRIPHLRHRRTAQTQSISGEQKEVFEKFHDCCSEYMSLAEAAIFEYAFKLGMQIAIETLTE